MEKSRISIIASIIVIAIVAGFPTRHSRTREDLVKTIDCSRTLTGYGASVEEGWAEMKDRTKFVIDIRSTESVKVLIKSGEQEIYSSSYDTIHAYTFTSSEHSFIVRVYSSQYHTEMTGSIKAYHVYEDYQWLPWWM